jgi:hypothetical protein
MFRLTIFIIALLLLAGAVEPSRGWFIALAVVSGLSLVFRRPFWRPFHRPDRFARRMARRFERSWSWEADW